MSELQTNLFTHPPKLNFCWDGCVEWAKFPKDNPESCEPSVSKMFPLDAAAGAACAVAPKVEAVGDAPNPLGLPNVEAPPNVGCAPNTGWELPNVAGPPKTGLEKADCCCGEPNPVDA